MWKLSSAQVSPEGDEIAVTLVWGDLRMTWFFELWTGKRYAIRTV